MERATSSTTETIETRCPDCGGKDLITASSAGLAAWRNGQYIQHALPELTDTQREQLISGICGPCWDGMFNDDEESEDEYDPSPRAFAIFKRLVEDLEASK